MTWKHLEPSVLSNGSWNRALVWADKAKVLVFGNTQFDLTSDYSRRAVNLDHIAVISLEAFGIYQPPNLVVPTKVQQAGLSMLDEKLASDFEVICDDGRRVKCSRKILSERWPWFAEQERELEDKAHGLISDAPFVDINDTLLGSFTPARLAPHNLTLPEPFPVCVALVQYFYTLSLTTPLQNRAPVLSALLFMSKQYKIERLNRLVVHALHERLDLSNAVGIYEIATLAGEQCLQVRALNVIHVSCLFFNLFFFGVSADKFTSLLRAARLEATIGKTQAQPSQAKAVPTTTLVQAAPNPVPLPTAFRLAPPALELLMPLSNELVLIH